MNEGFIASIKINDVKKKGIIVTIPTSSWPHSCAASTLGNNQDMTYPNATPGGANSKTSRKYAPIFDSRTEGKRNIAMIIGVKANGMKSDTKSAMKRLR